jgi:hypothetical protein
VGLFGYNKQLVFPRAADAAADADDADAPATGGISDAAYSVDFDKLPLTVNPPPLVRDSSQLSMFDHDLGHFTFSADLSPTCRKLYENVSGARVFVCLKDILLHACVCMIMLRNSTTVA